MSEDGDVHTVDLAEVQDELGRVVGWRPTALTPDAISKAAKHVDWKNLPGWESMSDAEIALRAGLYSAGLRGSLLVVTEASFAPGRGAFAVDSSDLGVFLSHHLTRYGEALFNGDVVVAER
jgi:hypothetical protein